VAGSLYTGSSTLNLPPNTIFYFILSNITDGKIEYLLTLTDKSQTDMLRSYGLGFYIDQGIGERPTIPTGTLRDNGNQLKIDMELTLGSMAGTAIPQSLVMAI
jgi:hypothetical protein